MEYIYGRYVNMSARFSQEPAAHEYATDKSGAVGCLPPWHCFNNVVIVVEPPPPTSPPSQQTSVVSNSHTHTPSSQLLNLYFFASRPRPRPSIRCHSRWHVICFSFDEHYSQCMRNYGRQPGTQTRVESTETLPRIHFSGRIYRRQQQFIGVRILCVSQCLGECKSRVEACREGKRAPRALCAWIIYRFNETE